MALFDSGSLIANVAITDTFDQWRGRTNQIISVAAGLQSNNSFTGSLNTFISVQANTISGNVTGNLVGNVTGNLTGNVSGSLVSANGLPIVAGTTGTLSVARGGTGITSFGTGVAAFLGTPSSANLRTAVTDETGSGALVFATSPTLVTPVLGTPQSATLTNATGLPTAGLVDNAVSNAKLRDSVALSVMGRSANSTGDPADIAADDHQVLRRSGTTLAFGSVALNQSAAVTGVLPVVNGGTGITSLADGVATFLGNPTSNNLRTVVTDETGSGALVFATSPTLVTPILGTPQSGTLTNVTGLPIVGGTTGTLSVARGGTGVTTSTGTGNVVLSGSPTFTGNAAFQSLSVSNDLTISGNLIVNGTTTTINSTTLTVDDKNIEIGSIDSPSDATADGGGITLKGTTDKTFNYVDATTSWTSNQDLNLLTGKVYKINGTSVLSNSTLGSGVLSSSLTSVGTITTGVWNGSSISTTFTDAKVVSVNGSTGVVTGIATTAGTLAQFGSTTSSQLATLISDETGSGALVFATSPTLVTPILGTPQSGTLTNATGLPLTTGVTGTLPVANGGTGQTSYTNGQLLIGNSTGNTLAKATLTAGTGITVTNGTGTITIAAVNNGTVTSVGGTGTVNGITLTGTVTSTGNLTLGGTLSNVSLTTQVTGTLPVANGGTGITSFGTGVATFLGTPSSANLAAAVTDETGSGALVFATSPTLVTPVLGTPQSGTLTNATGLPLSTGVTGTLPVANGGTGQTTYTNGQLLIGNTTGNTLAKATLTAGTGITVTNGAGTITIAAVNNGTVTSVGGTGTVNGITLTGTVTSTGNLTLGGTLSGVNLASQVTGTLPVANGGTGITSLGAGVATFLGTASSANLAAAVTDETGSGALVFATSPTLTTPNIGAATGTSAVLTGAAGVLTRAAATQDGVELVGRAGGTNSFKVSLTPTTLTASRTVTLADGNTTLQTGTMAVTGTALSQFAATTSSQLAGVISDETGSGALVFATSPTLVTPILGTPQSGTLTNATGLPIVGGTTGTLSVARGGTGQTSYTNGQLLIGNSTGNTLAKATLTAGTGITVTNGAGTITIAAVNNGTVTSVGGTGTVNGITLTGTVTSTGNLTLGGTLSGVDLASQVTGVLPVANGGTGANTAQLALNNIAGAVTTAQYLRGNGTNVVMSAIQAGDVPTLNQNTTGSAATLTTARTIGGVSFNGSANINLPGVNTAGNQNTTGSAATLTTGRTIALTGDVSYTSGSFNGSANVTGTATLASVGTAGTYTKVTTDAKGRVTSGTTLGAADIPNLDASKITTGTISADRLPSFVDDVEEYANLAAFPVTGETGKLYVALDNNKVYRWSGTVYIQITSGAVDSVAGKTGVVTLVKGDVGLGSVDNTADSAKVVASAGILTTARTIGGVSFNGSANINLPGVNAAGNQNTTGTAANVTGTVAVANGGTGRTTLTSGNYLKGAGTSAIGLQSGIPAGDITSGTLAVARGGTGQTSYTNGQLLIGNTTGNTLAKATLTAGTGITVTNGAGTITIAAVNNGTVTSVGGTGTVNGITLTGTVTSSGNLTLGGTLSGVNLTSQVTGVLPVANGGTGSVNTQLALNNIGGAVTAGQYLRGNGTNIVMSAIQAGDVPTLNQNTTGSAATLTTARTIGGVSFNGSANINLPGVNTAGNQNTTGTAANVTGTVAVANGGTGQTTYTNGQLLIGNSTGNTLAKATLTAGTGITVTNGTGTITIAAVNNGTVTSVGGTGTVSGLTLTGTVTSTGNLTLGGTLAVTASNFASQTAKTFLAAPNATAGVPTFRAIVASDIPTLNQNTTGSAATLTTARTIGGVSFNGSANINLPGVNTAGNQNTSGSAATLTTSRAINGTNFNGSAAITVPGNFANRTTAESGHAIFISTTATGNQSMFTNTNYRFNPSTAELSATNFNSTSDINKKHNINTIENALEIVSNLRGVRFNWNHNDQAAVGVIAQEIEQHLPEVVVDSDDSKSVQYGPLVGVLIEAIKEQQKQINQLKLAVEMLNS